MMLSGILAMTFKVAGYWKLCDARPLQPTLVLPLNRSSGAESLEPLWTIKAVFTGANEPM